MQKLDATQVLLLRHGESTFNQQGRCQGCSDESVLSEKGKRTAVLAGAYLRHQPPDVIFASPLRRARETAEIVRATLRSSAVRVVLHELLREADLPFWEGLTYDQVRSNFSREYRTWREHPDLLRMGGARPVADLYRRAGRFWTEIRPQWAGKSVLIVSHLGTCRALIGSALGIPAKFYHRTQHSNGGLSVLEFDGAEVNKPGFCRVKALNLTGHLERVLPKLKEGKRGVRLLLLPSDGGASTRLLDEWKADFVTSTEALNGENFYPVDGTVRTGVVIAPAPSLLSILMTAIGARQQDGSRWAMRDGHISVLHYPKLNGAGVLQVFNSPVAMQTGERSTA